MISLTAGFIIAGKYRLDAELGAGGMGAVWRARHLQLDVPVAIKCIDPELARAPEAKARFEREARACAQLKSPHVVQVHDYGIEGDTPYLVMELLDGEDLQARFHREHRLELPAAAALFNQMCKGIRHAHEAGIIHRDLKPGNIFIARVHGEEVVKILDFGIAKEGGIGKADQVTKTGSLIGTPSYMSPEQARRNRALDHRSDLWSLAVILFRGITGSRPFEGEELADVLVKICSEPIPKPSWIAPDLPPEVDRFFVRALARDPAERFQSAREMAEAFAVVAGVSTGEISLTAGPPPALWAPAGAVAEGVGSSTISLDAPSPSVPSAPSEPVPHEPTPWAPARPAPASARGPASLGQSGSLAPAGISVGTAPATPQRRSTAAIAAVMLAATALLGIVGFILLRAGASHGDGHPQGETHAPVAAPSSAAVDVAPTPSALPAPTDEAPQPTAVASVVPALTATHPVAGTPGARPAGPAHAASTAAPKASASARAPSMFGF